MGEASPGTRLIKLENRTKIPMPADHRQVVQGSVPDIIFEQVRHAQRHRILRSSSSITCCVPPGRSTERRARSHRKNTTAKAKTSNLHGNVVGDGILRIAGLNMQGA